MAVVKDSDLVKSLRAGDYSSVYYFHGKDVMTIESYTGRLMEKLLGKCDDTYNLHRFSGKEIDLSELSDCVDALPFFGERVCITVNDLNAEDLSANDLTFLLEVVGNIPDTTTVIFYNTGIDITGGKKFPTAKNKKLIDACSKAGTVCEFAYKKPSELVKPIMGMAQKQGSSISKQNAEYLAGQCLSNMTLIHNEIQKLTSYADGGEVTAEMIDLLVAKQLDSNSFALARAVTSFQTGTAMKLLDELFAQRTEPVAILSALSMSFVDLYRARVAMNEGRTAQNVTEDFGYKANRSFAVENAFRDARRTSAEHLRRCLKILADTDIALKSSRGDGRLLIEKAITEMAVSR